MCECDDWKQREMEKENNEVRQRGDMAIRKWEKTEAKNTSKRIMKCVYDWTWQEIDKHELRKWDKGGNRWQHRKDIKTGHRNK